MTVRVLIATLFAFAMPLAADQRLGVIEFPNSGSAEAQDHFLTGVLLMHNFEYDDAAAAFRRAHETDPSFGMAYWGEAMSCNRPLRRLREWDLPRQALERLGPTREARLAKVPTERGKGFVRAVDALFFGVGEETDRRVAYADELERLAAAHPDDRDARRQQRAKLLDVAERDRLSDRLAGLPVDVWPSGANFVLIRTRHRDGAELHLHNMLIQPFRSGEGEYAINRRPR